MKKQYSQPACQVNEYIQDTAIGAISGNEEGRFNVVEDMDF